MKLNLGWVGYLGGLGYCILVSNLGGKSRMGEGLRGWEIIEYFVK